MINIVVFCNPNYTKKKIINTIKKNIDIVSQFIILYKSIKLNWKHYEYRISLFHNKNIKFNDYDKNRLNECEIDIYECIPDNENLPYYCRCACFYEKLKYPGTHRLVLDCDMIALSELTLDLNNDWQAMFAGTIDIEKNYIDYIITKYDYYVNYEKYNIFNNLFLNYNINNKPYEEIFPYFNGGAILIKEELCIKFVNLWKKSLELSYNKKLPKKIQHIGLQYSMSFALINLSNKWKPFRPGINFLLKSYDINKFGKKNISLLHYCGINAGKIAKKEFPEYFT